MLPSGQTALGRVLRLPLRLVPRTAVVPVLSGLNRGLRWRVGAGPHGCWIGIYEAAKQRVVRELVRHGMNVVDIGAHAGFYTLAFSRLVGAGRVWAFEPVPQLAQRLEFHVAENALANVTIHRLAVAERVGSARFRFLPDYETMGALDEGGAMTVATTTLDSLVAAGMPVPDVVKIDVEGAELRILEGAAALIARRRTAWLVALDDPSTREATFGRLAGYRVQEFCPGEIVALP